MTGLQHVGTCATCGKRCYASRDVAKRVARSLKGDRSGTHLGTYRCGAYWHLGHLPVQVVRGVIGRDEIRRASGGNAVTDDDLNGEHGVDYGELTADAIAHMRHALTAGADDVDFSGFYLDDPKSPPRQNVPWPFYTEKHVVRLLETDRQLLSGVRNHQPNGLRAIRVSTRKGGFIWVYNRDDVDRVRGVSRRRS